MDSVILALTVGLMHTTTVAGDVVDVSLEDLDRMPTQFDGRVVQFSATLSLFEGPAVCSPDPVRCISLVLDARHPRIHLEPMDGKTVKVRGTFVAVEQPSVSQRDADGSLVIDLRGGIHELQDTTLMELVLGTP
jgi:hypothetical protein